MDERIIDLSEEPAFLNVRYNQLIIKRDRREDSLPLEDLAVLIVSHPAVSLTHAVLSGLCANAGAFIICDDRRLPTGMMLPLVGNSTLTERHHAQINASSPVNKRLWQQIIMAKIRAQASVLNDVEGNDCGLSVLSTKVLSGDSSNIEARASRHYWPILFGDSFRRTYDSNDGINVHLNYGYGVLRAIVGRAITASGLLPSVGIHHHNKYNPFCLADDLMEPFRPLIDATVYEIIDIFGPDHPIDKDSKAVILEKLLNQKWIYKKENRKLFDIVSKLTASLVQVYAGEKKKIIIPKIYDL